MKPKLRFKNYDKDWGLTILQNISSKFDYGICASAVEFDGKHKYIRITDIDDVSRKYMPNPIMSPDVITNNRYIVKENDILFARTGATTGKTYLFDKNDGLIYFAGFLIRFNIFNANPHFIFYKTLTKQYKHWIDVTSIRSGQPGINAEELKKYKLFIPSLAEQNKIATFLNLYYKKIELQKKKIDLLKLLLKQKINDSFSQKNNSPKIKLSNIITQISIRNKNNLDIPVLSVNNKNGFVPQNEQFEEEVASEDKSGYKIIKVNQFAYNPARINVGSIARLKNKYIFGQISPMYICFECCDKVYNDYFEYYLKSQTFKKEMSKRLEGSVRMCLSYESLCNIKIQLPDLGEQKQISDNLFLIENKINLEEQKLTFIEKYKQGLLHQMFV